MVGGAGGIERVQDRLNNRRAALSGVAGDRGIDQGRGLVADIGIPNPATRLLAQSGYRARCPGRPLVSRPLHTRQGCPRWPSVQLGRASAPTIPKPVQAMRGPKDGTAVIGPAIVPEHRVMAAQPTRTPLPRVMPSFIGTGAAGKH